MNYFTEQKIPKILMINFTEYEQKKLIDLGFNVEKGYVGSQEERNDDWYLGYYFQSAPYEYDIVIFNSKRNPKEESNLPKVYNLHEDRSRYEDFEYLQKAPLIIAFSGYESSNNLMLAGLPFIYLKVADERDTRLLIAQRQTFGIDEVSKFLEKHKDKIITVTQYLYSTVKDPIYHSPLVVNYNHDQIAAYGTTYSGRTILQYLVLPQFRNNSEILVDLMTLLVELRPELFPEIKRVDWIDSPEFLPLEIKKIQGEIEDEIIKAKKIIDSKMEQMKVKGEELKFLKQILIADDEHFEGDNKLKPSVLKVLDFLGFKVIDMDKQVENGKKKEDLLLSDETDGFRALVEVKGTNKQNVPVSYYTQLLGHLRKSHDSTIRGLLIINHDRINHPYKRTLLYADDEELFGDENDIGVLSTVELYKIISVVRDGKISKEKAREVIKGTNRIVFSI